MQRSIRQDAAVLRKHFPHWYMSASEAAAYVGFVGKTGKPQSHKIRRMRDNGKIHSYMIEGNERFLSSELQTLITLKPIPIQTYKKEVLKVA